jgi:hypothetical protein
LGAGFSFFPNLWDRKSGELFQKFNKISRMHTTEEKKIKNFPILLPKKLEISSEKNH